MYETRWIIRNGQRVLQSRTWIKTNAYKRKPGDASGYWSHWKDVPTA